MEGELCPCLDLDIKLFSVRLVSPLPFITGHPRLIIKTELEMNIGNWLKNAAQTQRIFGH